MIRSILLFSLTILVSQAYVFECLDKCECDTKDEVIHCHNGERTTLHLPENERLRGFHAIGLTYNKIVKLPKEDEVLEKFPNLLAIDVERNEDFDCDSLLEYTKVKIISDCYKNVTDISQIPLIHRPTSDCDFTCQANKHYVELHKYVLRLWEIIKEKYNNFDKDQTLQQIKAFIIDTVQKINRKIDKGLEEFHPRNQKAGRTIPSEETTLPSQVVITAAPAVLETAIQTEQDVTLDN